MRALITGACGFVGRYLAEHALASGDTVLAGTIIERQWPAQIATVKLDVTDAAQCARVIGDFRPDVVYHLAGLAFVPEAEDNFERALRINVVGTSNIYRTCHLMQSGVTVLSVSSAEVYGRVEQRDLPLNESLKPRPGNNYSLSKLMAELVAERYAQGGYVRSIVVRPFNHIGPGQDKRFVSSNFAHQLAQIAKGKALPRIEVGNLQARRDFSDVRDVVRAYRLMAERGKESLYNLGAGKSVAIQSILDTLIEISGLTVEVVQDPARMRSAEVPEVFGDISRARSDLGWEPKISLRESLQDIYATCLKQLSA